MRERGREEGEREERGEKEGRGGRKRERESINNNYYTYVYSLPLSDKLDTRMSCQKHFLFSI